MDRKPEAAQEPRRALVLIPTSAVCEIAARDDQLRSCSFDERRERALDVRVGLRADVEVGDVEEPGWHRPGTLYTQNVVDESAEIFDDLYVGLRAGGALRKQRRGEPLTAEEQEALGRWQRLSPVRKALAVGAFGVGTFGLGFTLGGLIFGRWRRARA
jgi:hypothetical protein